MAGLARQMVVNSISKIIESLRSSYSTGNQEFPYATDEETKEALLDLLDLSADGDLLLRDPPAEGVFFSEVLSELRESLGRLPLSKTVTDDTPPAKRARTGLFARSSRATSEATGPPVSRSISGGGASLAPSSSQHEDPEDEGLVAGPSSASQGKTSSRKRKKSSRKW